MRTRSSAIALGVTLTAAVLSARSAAGQSTADSMRTAGSSADFAARIVRVAYNPSRATIELSRPAYVTLISVTDAGIEAILPAAGMKQKIVGGGTHVASLSRQMDAAANGIIDRFGDDGRTVIGDDITADDLREYNRCLSAARSAESNRKKQGKITGYDKDGKPIYGPADEPMRDPESACRVPTARKAAPAGPSQAPTKGRYLLLFASDTPIEFRDITDLAVTESNIRLVSAAIGKKLFGIRNAQWSGYIAPW